MQLCNCSMYIRSDQCPMCTGRDLQFESTVITLLAVGTVFDNTEGLLLPWAEIQLKIFPLVPQKFVVTIDNNRKLVVYQVFFV